MKIIKLENSDNYIFDKICEWNYNWWGKRDNLSYEEVRCNLEHSLNEERLPQTYVLLIDDEPAGMYQLSIVDQIFIRGL